MPKGRVGRILTHRQTPLTPGNTGEPVVSFWPEMQPSAA
ncbi:MAG: hypothetical protein JWM68_299, partial [Verrucomicrobiales bacterium]|nr:hypothetical protein [Verrucomicrobiales bacterium]